MILNLLSYFWRWLRRAPRRTMRALSGSPAPTYPSAWRRHLADDCHGACFYCANPALSSEPRYHYRHPTNALNRRARRARGIVVPRSRV
jgi:hypothetical protein